MTETWPMYWIVGEHSVIRQSSPKAPFEDYQEGGSWESIIGLWFAQPKPGDEGQCTENEAVKFIERIETDEKLQWRRIFLYETWGA